MRLRDLAIPALISLPIIGYFIGRVTATVPVPNNATLYIHVKHSPPFPDTMGHVQQIYRNIYDANKTGLDIGIEPQVTGTWDVALDYLRECDKIPVMLNVLTSDDALQLDTLQIIQAMGVCNVRWLRFHEALSFFDPFPLAYVQSILAFAKAVNIPIFWNEWNIDNFPMIASIIQGYEDNVAVSFGTNSTQLEPIDGFQLLQQFQRRAASVQSWYWWERNGRQDGYEYLMPTDLMRIHSQQAFQAGCEVIQYEPYGYFFDGTMQKPTLTDVLNGSLL